MQKFLIILLFISMIFLLSCSSSVKEKNDADNNDNNDFSETDSVTDSDFYSEKEEIQDNDSYVDGNNEEIGENISDENDLDFSETEDFEISDTDNNISDADFLISDEDDLDTIVSDIDNFEENDEMLDDNEILDSDVSLDNEIQDIDNEIEPDDNVSSDFISNIVMNDYVKSYSPESADFINYKKKILVEFKPIEGLPNDSINPATVNILIKDTKTNEVVETNMFPDSKSGVKFWYMPIHYWKSGTEYIVTIKKGVKAQMNNTTYEMKSDASWNFRIENFDIEEDFSNNGDYDLTMEEELFINDLLKSDLGTEIVTDYTNSNSSLLEFSKPVDPENQLIKQLCAKMISFVAASNSRQGLAAPQIGLNRRFFIAKLGSETRAFINPKIDWKKESEETSPDKGKVYSASEGCLSVPGESYKIYRPYYINVIFDEYKNGVVTKAKSEKLVNTPNPIAPLSQQPARVWLHEFDHLNGILINDRGVK